MLTGHTEAMIERYGQAVILRRQLTVSPITFNDVSVRAIVREYRPSEIIGTLKQGDRKVVISNKEIAAAAWPGPPKVGDRVTINGATTTVKGVETRRVGEAIALHVLTVTG